MPETLWIVRGYNGSEQTFEITSPKASLTESDATLALQCLVAKSLDEEEILASCRRRKAKGRRSLLEVSRCVGPSSGNYSLTLICGRKSSLHSRSKGCLTCPKAHAERSAQPT